MKFEVITKKNQFINLKDAWESILFKSQQPSITQTWEWMKTWWDVYGEERDLMVVCGRKNDKLVGIAPFSRRKQFTKYFKILNFKTLNLIGSGNTTARGVVSDYLDFIIEQGFEDVFVNGFFRFISIKNIWDEILLENISINSPLPEKCNKYAAKNNLKYSIINKNPCALIKLPDSWDDFLKTLSSSMRYKINRGRRELKKVGGNYREVNSEAELPEAFKQLERLHQNRWQSKGELGSFSSPEWKKFHKQLMELLLPKGMLKLSFLEINNKPVAANYNFLFNKKIHFFQSGVIPHENKHIRVGLLLHSFCIEEAINEGCTEYDFLSIGTSGPGYKSMWENHFRDMLNLRIARKTNKENVFSVLRTIVSCAKQMKFNIINRPPKTQTGRGICE